MIVTQAAIPDRDFLKTVLEEADPNVLRMVLLQLTQEPALETMRVEKKPIRAGVLMLSVLAPEHHAEVRERMLDYLMGERTTLPPTLPPMPSAP